MATIGPREAQLQQLREDGRKAKQRRLADKPATIDHLKHIVKGKKRNGQKPLRAARNAKAP
jgi:hypothetical protein